MYPESDYTGNNFDKNLQIAVTFDDFPFHEIIVNMEHLFHNTQKLLEDLKNNRIKAIAFVNEKHFYTPGESKNFFELIKLWLDSGMEFGNHTFSHLSLHKVPIQNFMDDIVNGERILLPVLLKEGKKLFFRYPYLETGNSINVKNEIADFLKKRGYTDAPVSIETFDYLFSRYYFLAKVNKQNNLMEKIAELYLFYCEKFFEYYENFSLRIFNRQIKHTLLLHFNDLNIDCFNKIINLIKKRGYAFITLDEALNDTAYHIDDKFTGNYGLTWLHRCNLAKSGNDKFHQDWDENQKIISIIKSELSQKFVKK